MIKRKLLTLSLILILSVLSIAEAGDPNEAITFWLSGSDLAYQNTNLSAWLGYRNDNTEVGVAMDWRMFAEGDNDEDLQSDFAIGPYGCFHMPGLIEIDNPFEASWLPEKLAGDPFVALSYLFDVHGEGTLINPAVGMRVLDMFALTYDYSFFHGTPVENEGKIGLSYQLRF